MSRDVDVFFVDVSFKSEGLEPLLASLRELDEWKKDDEESKVETELVELSSTELGDGRILQTRMLQPVVSPAPKVQHLDLEEEIAAVLRRILPDCLAVNILPVSGRLAVGNGEEDSISWRDLNELRDLFDLLAPYLEEESKIEFSETVWNIWRWVVNEGKIVEQAGEVTYV